MLFALAFGLANPTGARGLSHQGLIGRPNAVGLRYHCSGGSDRARGGHEASLEATARSRSGANLRTGDLVQIFALAYCE